MLKGAEVRTIEHEELQQETSEQVSLAQRFREEERDPLAQGFCEVERDLVRGEEIA